MCTETIQLGTWNLCVGWLVAFLPLVGVVFGAVMGFGASIVLDNRRRSWELKEKKREEKREALRRAFEWFEPMRQAYYSASNYAHFLMDGDIDELGFREQYPHEAIEDLKDLDLPEHLTFFLPDEAYVRRRKILTDLRELYDLALRNIGKGREAHLEVIQFSDILFVEMDDLWVDLKAEYEKTYE